MILNINNEYGEFKIEDAICFTNIQKKEKKENTRMKKEGKEGKGSKEKKWKGREGRLNRFKSNEMYACNQEKTKINFSIIKPFYKHASIKVNFLNSKIHTRNNTKIN
jgi:hypothetical protein